MWSTIANFKDNLSQIASDVLDTADELKRVGSQGDFDDEVFDTEPASHRSSYSNRESDLRSELEWYRVEVTRLKAAESAVQSTCVNYISTLKEKEEEILNIREENGILKERLTTSVSENHTHGHDKESDLSQLQEALKNQDSLRRHSEELHQKQLSDQRDHFLQQHNKVVARHREELAEAKGLRERNDVSLEKPVTSNGLATHLPNDSQVEKLESLLLQLQETEKGLRSQISEKDETYFKLRTSYDESLSEIAQLKAQQSQENEASLIRESQLHRDQEAAETSARELEKLRLENAQISEDLHEVQQRLNGKEAETDVSFEELSQSISNLEKEKLELQEERSHLLKRLEEDSSLDKASAASAEVVSESELAALKETAQEVDRLRERINEADETTARQKDEFEARLERASADRDKAIRDLARLRQHLLDKETADSEKMDQDSEQIADLQARANLSVSRAIKAEQALSIALADLKEAKRHRKEELSKAFDERSSLDQRLAASLSALEAKDLELSNLQIALGQYYAESEARDRVFRELKAAREEQSKLSQQLKEAHEIIEQKNEENKVNVEKLVSSEKRLAETKMKMQKIEEEVLRLRRALEQSMTRLNSLSSDSDHNVDRRIVIKLLVTYFQRNHSKEVLDLMARILGFSEQEKKRVGLAQQAASKGVVRGVLGLPGRFVGGIIGSASADNLSIPSPSENKSFADLWIDFLLKESEEREKREKAEAIERAEKEMGSSEFRHQASENRLNSLSASGSISTPASPALPIRDSPTTSFSSLAASAQPFADPSASSFLVKQSPQSSGSTPNGKIFSSHPGAAVEEKDFSGTSLSSSHMPGNSGGSVSYLKLPPRS